ncbi:MAG: DUF2075 domain-containing protein [Fimbriimonadaceae bacterium]|nr:DUF2075 domain-containing protein [Fimbriimonadaceae bacterium]
MVVYRSNVKGFLSDILSNQIEEIVHSEFRRRLNKSVGASELASWKNSLQAMSNVLADRDIPGDAGVAIEFCLAPTGRRIDILLSGVDKQNQLNALIIELKQWSDAEVTSMDGIVRTFVGGAVRETSHPSYQAWTYAQVLQDFNEAVQTENIKVQACAYLHNCTSSHVIHDPFYTSYTNRAPAFLKSDGLRLQHFVKSHVEHGDSGRTLELLDNGRIRPSKGLSEAIAAMLTGNPEFTLIDDQKVVYETALHLASIAKTGKKQVLIIEGGPGTGKSVVAINLLVELTKRGQIAQYVTRNAAPRAVYESKLSGTFSKSRISQLFVGSGAFREVEKNLYDSLIIDEAHRLNEKSGLFQNLGINQVLEIIEASRFSVFFIDEDQRVTFKDIGSKAEIQKWAESCGASVTSLQLESQFRCNGSDGYMAWIDNTLQIRETANPTLEGIDYEFLVCETPNQLRDKIISLNEFNNRSRMVAGYCWEWPSKQSPQLVDIVLPEYNFFARWNLQDDGSLWLIKPNSVHEIGCIHTCQGLELDFVGVLIGPDLIVRDGKIITDASKRAKTDSSVKGFKSLLRSSPDEANFKADLVIKNTYRTLMTRGQKGCFIWSVDPETNEYLKHSSRKFVSDIQS